MYGVRQPTWGDMQYRYDTPVRTRCLCMYSAVLPFLATPFPRVWKVFKPLRDPALSALSCVTFAGLYHALCRQVAVQNLTVCCHWCCHCRYVIDRFGARSMEVEEDACGLPLDEGAPELHAVKDAGADKERDQLAHALERLADVQRELAEGQRSLMSGQKQLAEQQARLVALMKQEVAPK
jgi:hypothetical protein